MDRQRQQWQMMMARIKLKEVEGRRKHIELEAAEAIKSFERDPDNEDDEEPRLFWNTLTPLETVTPNMNHNIF